MNPLMLFEDVPLVTTQALGSYFASELIGHHYGDLSNSRVRCVKVEPSLFLCGAHPWQEVTQCFVAGARTRGFEAITRTDTDGITRQYVGLTVPIANETDTVEISGKGKQSEINGKLLENPDEIIQDIASLSGRVLNFPLFREACNRRGLRIAGSVYEARSLRAYINEIAESCGALWLNDNIIFYPGGDLGYAKPFPYPENLNHEISQLDVAGLLGVYYGWNQSSQRNGSYIELTAVGSQYSNKGIYYAKWLRLARDAEELARRLLAKRAGEFVKTRATVGGVVRAGAVVALASPNFNGPMLVTDAQPSEAQTQISGEIILSLYSNLKITAFSNEQQSLRSERVDVLLNLVKHEATITVFDGQNRPMAGIFITYDSAVTKKTDRNGSAVFSVTTGNHTLVLAGSTIDNNEPYPFFVP